VFSTVFFFFRAEDGIRDFHVTGVQTCALPISTGFSAVSQNIGAMVNTGWEFTVKRDVVRYKDFNWYTNFNLAMNRNAITKLPDRSEERRVGKEWRSRGEP